MKPITIAAVIALVLLLAQLMANQIDLRDRDRELQREINHNYTLILDLYNRVGAADSIPHKTKRAMKPKED